MLVLFVWFAGVAASIKEGLIITAIVTALLTGAVSLFAVLEDGLNTKFRKFSAVALFAFAGLMFTVAHLIPSEKTVYMMGGAYVASEVVTSESANKVKELINMKLDEYIQETKDNMPAIKEAAKQKVIETVNESVK